MFNVTRTLPAPSALARNNYQSREVVESLRRIFHDKCYLCEQGDVSNPEVEHFVPHGDKPALKYDWNNLFYVCRRCNGIKSSSIDKLLDCTDGNVDVFNEIVHLAGNAISGEIEVRANSLNPSDETKNTVALLKRCFNEANTGYREISKQNLHEKILNEFADYFSFRRVLVSRLSTPLEIQDALDRLKLMCSVNYPFSVFWKWHIITDNILNKKYPNIRIMLGF
ncbi:HNH endonuclease [Pantoea ananatis]|uniref:HNH endonuclease n=1 Tax=Pantoea ananas TaxID=553 RepID=UPI001B3174F8|nr:HNH endonuclease [Pantoea ananatis]